MNEAMFSRLLMRKTLVVGIRPGHVTRFPAEHVGRRLVRDGRARAGFERRRGDFSG